MSSGKNLNRIGNNTHKLIGENLGGEVILLATGTFEFCMMVYRDRLESIINGKLKLHPGDKIYVAEVNPEIITYGPDFDYEIMGRKL